MSRSYDDELLLALGLEARLFVHLRDEVAGQLQAAVVGDAQHLVDLDVGAAGVGHQVFLVQQDVVEVLLEQERLERHVDVGVFRVLGAVVVVVRVAVAVVRGPVVLLLLLFPSGPSPRRVRAQALRAGAAVPSAGRLRLPLRLLVLSLAALVSAHAELVHPVFFFLLVEQVLQFLAHVVQQLAFELAQLREEGLPSWSPPESRPPASSWARISVCSGSLFRALSASGLLRGFRRAPG